MDISAREKVRVKSVPDGDGLKLTDGRRVRYLGIDAPEVANFSRPAEPYALEAQNFNRLMVKKRPVVIIPDGLDKDKNTGAT